MNTWEDLKWWDCGEWQVIEERLDELDQKGILYNPRRELIFASLDSVEYNAVRAVVIGQDPYPDRKFATGVAFSIPQGLRKFPESLLIIYKEYCRDLGLEWPKSGCLNKWAREGVLLMNAIPTCLTFQSKSHQGWFEWEFFTKEIIEVCDERKVPFVLAGGVARSFKKYIKNSPVLEVSHPSRRAMLNSNVPFVGAGVFSWVNKQLEVPINWQL